MKKLALIIIAATLFTGCQSLEQDYRMKTGYMPQFDRSANMHAKAKVVYCGGKDVKAFGMGAFNSWIICEDGSNFVFKTNEM